MQRTPACISIHNVFLHIHPSHLRSFSNTSPPLPRSLRRSLHLRIATIGIPDILIVDEVLSVGDFRFQEKCEARIQNMKDQGTTILFVSHSIEQVKKICNKVVWLDHGVLKMFGDAQEICSIYEKA